MCNRRMIGADTGAEPCPGPMPELDAARLAERAARLLMREPDLSLSFRAALLRSAADGDISAALDALTGWAVIEERRKACTPH